MAVDVYGIRVEIEKAQESKSDLDSLRASLRATDSETSRLNGTLNNFDSALNSIKFAAIVAGIGTAVYALKEFGGKLVEAASSVGGLKSKLNLLSGSDVAFDKMVQSAGRLGVSLDVVQGMTSRFILMRDAIGITSGQAQKLTDTVLMLGRIGGSNMEEMKTAALQFSQALGSGKLQGDEFRSIMESMPLLGKTIADSLGRSVGALKQMSTEGELTADVISGALLRASTAVAAQYEQLPKGLSQAKENLETQITLLEAYLGKMSGILRAWTDVYNMIGLGAKNMRLVLGGGTQDEGRDALLKEIEDQKEMVKSAQDYLDDFPNSRKAQENVNGLIVILGQLQDKLKQLNEGRVEEMRLGQTADYAKMFEPQLSAYEKMLAQTQKIKDNVAAIKKFEPEVKSAIATASEKYGFDPNLLSALMQFESGGKAGAVALDKNRQPIQGGGQGLGQFIPSTWQQMKMPGWSKEDVFDAQKNADATVRYLQKLYDQFGTWDVAIAHYIGLGKKLGGDETEIHNIKATTAALFEQGGGLVKNARDAKELIDNLSPLAKAQADFAEGKKKASDLLASDNITVGQYRDRIIQLNNAYYDAINPNKQYLELKQQEVNIYRQAIAENKTVEQIREEIAGQTELNKIKKDGANYRGDLTAAQDLDRQLIETKKNYEDLQKATKLGIEFDPGSRVRKAQVEYNENVRLANIYVAAHPEARNAFNAYLKEQGDILERMKKPNEAYLQSMEAEILLYQKAAASGMGVDELNRELKLREEIAKLNPAAASYQSDVERLKQMSPILEELKDRFSETNQQAEVFKTAATDIYQAWTAAFEGIFDKGIKGFSSLKDSILQIFKHLIAQLATLSISQSIIAPVIGVIGGVLGVSESSMAGLLKQFGSSTTTVGGLGGTATSIGTSLSGLWQQITTLFGGGTIPTATTGPTFGQAAAMAGGSAWAPYEGEGSLQASAMQSTATMATPGTGAYGLAGVGGYAVGSYLGGGTNYSQIGGTIGAVAGMVIGNMIVPGIGGVVGAVAGSVLGSLLGGAVGGGKKKTKLVTMSGGDTGDYDIAGGTRMMTETSFGKFGFGEATKNMDEWLQKEGQEIMQSVKDADSALAKLLTPEEMTAAKAAIANWKSQGTDINQALLERYQLIINATDTMWKGLVSRATDVQDLMDRFSAIRSISDIVGKDLLKDAAKSMENQFNQSIDKLRENTDSLLESLDGFTGTTKQLQDIASLVQERYTLELQMLVQVKQAMEGVKATIDTATESIKQSMMTTEQLYPYLTQKAQDLAGTITSMTDPTEIQSTVDRITAIVNQAYQLMTPEQKATTGQQYIDWLNQIQALADYQLKGVQDQLVYENQQTAAMLKAALDAQTNNQAVVLTAIGDAIVAAIRALRPVNQASGFVPGIWNGQSGIAGDTVLAIRTPGEAVIPRAAAQQHRGLIGAMLSGKLQYQANGTEEEYVGYLSQHLGDYFPGGNVYINYVPGEEFEVKHREKGKDKVLAGTKWLWNWMDTFDIPGKQPVAPIVPIEPTPAPIQAPAPALPPALPALPPTLPAINRSDLKSPIEQMMSELKASQLQAAKQMPGWDELGYQRGQVSSAQAQLTAAGTDPDKQLAALGKLQTAIQGRYDAEIAEINKTWQVRQTQLQEEISNYQALITAAKGIKEYVDSLKLSDLTILKPKERLAEAQAQYQTTLQKAQGGDVEAAQALQGKAQAYLKESRSYYASGGAGGEYKGIFTSVTDQLSQFADSTQATAAAGIKAAQDELAKGPDYSPAFNEMNDSLSQIISVLQQINTTTNAGADTAYNLADITQYIKPMAAGGLVALTPGEAVLGRDIVSQHRPLVNALLHGQVDYAAEGLPANVVPFPQRPRTAVADSGPTDKEAALVKVAEAVQALSAVVMATTQRQTGEIVAATDRVTTAVNDGNKPKPIDIRRVV